MKEVSLLHPRHLFPQTRLPVPTVHQRSLLHVHLTDEQGDRGTLPPSHSCFLTLLLSLLLQEAFRGPPTLILLGFLFTPLMALASAASSCPEFASRRLVTAGLVGPE